MFLPFLLIYVLTSAWVMFWDIHRMTLIQISNQESKPACLPEFYAQIMENQGLVFRNCTKRNTFEMEAWQTA